ncbi:MAG TPA: phosphonate ABC transporter, permease protein PhnE [Stellaceae bacterium]|nr:phosphonate ABC transporter, permease protein PhnE [Stellaceae bacterium]
MLHEDPVARFERDRAALARIKRRQTVLFLGLFVLAFLASAYAGEFYPSKLYAGLPRTGEYLYRIMPTLRFDALFEGSKVKGSIAYWFYRFTPWALMLLETVQMAFLATVAAAIVGGAASFAASRNLVRGRVGYFLVRRLLELLRTVPELVYALILVWAFGVGPLAGVIAIFLHTTGALGKLFAEANENLDLKPLDGIRAAGGNWVQAMRFGALPQVLPNFASYILLRFEINVRGASVVGFVGAGGIGQELNQVISQNYYEEISAIVLLVILCVVAIDLASEAVRHRLIGRESLA